MDMLAARVHRFGGPEVISVESVPVPEPGRGEILVRVQAAGVGPWDAWIRSGQSVLPQPLPLTLGSDISGFVERVGVGVSAFAPGDAVYGVTNKQFTGGNAEFAVASANMMAHMPASLSHMQAASVPVVAVTAWQMLFTHAGAHASQTVFVHGGAGNVGAYAIQLARRLGLSVLASARATDVEYVKELGAGEVVDTRSPRMRELAGRMDVVLDTVGGLSQASLFPLLKEGGVLVSAVSQPDPQLAEQFGVRALFLLVDVSSAELSALAEAFDGGTLTPALRKVLPLKEIRAAHELLAQPAGGEHGKIVLSVAR